MASAPKPQLPLFYKDLLPLNSRDHADWKVASFDDASFMAETHAIPLTVDEFVDAQRHYPIVFTANDTPLPIALMGLNEGVNVFIGDDGSRRQVNRPTPEKSSNVELTVLGHHEPTRLLGLLPDFNTVTQL